MRAGITSVLVLAMLVASPMTPVLGAESRERSVESSGKQLFHARCGACHLAGGSGTLILARRLGKEKSLLEERKDLLPLYIRTVVRQGLGSMPWFTRVELPDTELNDIAEYLSPISR